MRYYIQIISFVASFIVISTGHIGELNDFNIVQIIEVESDKIIKLTNISIKETIWNWKYIKSEILDTFPTEQAVKVESKLINFKNFCQEIEENFKLLDDIIQLMEESTFRYSLFDIVPKNDRINEKAKLLDESLYVEPTLFDYIVKNENATCKSAIKQIGVLYHYILNCEKEKIDFDIWITATKEERLAKKSAVDPATNDAIYSRYLMRTGRAFTVALDYLTMANNLLCR